MVAVDDGWTSFWNIFFVDDAHFPKEQVGGVHAIRFYGEICSHVKI